ncbi:MAG: ferritin-like domain-containing protein [Pseudonocardia sp.]|nr:ferritin-like domain-containing protein [Pseudonocardia sp.]
MASTITTMTSNTAASNTTALIRQLRTILALTQAEAQIARIRVAQARTERVRAQLARIADHAEQRSGLLTKELRALGGVPDAVAPLIGRLTSALQATVEQGEPLDEALLHDLALEQKLRARARYLNTLARSGHRKSISELAEHLEAAHIETIEWLTTVLDEEAIGGPSALRATPAQRLAGRVTRLASLPMRFARDRVNQTLNLMRGVGVRAKDTAEDFTDQLATVGHAAREVAGAGRDAGLSRAEDIARREGATDTAASLHAARRELGSLSEAELAVPSYDELDPREAIRRIRELDDRDDVRAILRYEKAHKDRAGVVSTAEVQLATLARKAEGVEA